MAVDRPAPAPGAPCAGHAPVGALLGRTDNNGGRDTPTGPPR